MKVITARNKITVFITQKAHITFYQSIQHRAVSIFHIVVLSRGSHSAREELTIENTENTMQYASDTKTMQKQTVQIE